MENFHARLFQGIPNDRADRKHQMLVDEHLLFNDTLEDREILGVERLEDRVFE